MGTRIVERAIAALLGFVAVGEAKRRQHTGGSREGSQGNHKPHRGCFQCPPTDSPTNDPTFGRLSVPCFFAASRLCDGVWPCVPASVQLKSLRHERSGRTPESSRKARTL